MKNLLIYIVLISPVLSWSQKAEMSLDAVTSLEKLSWSIAGNMKGENPNVFSELQWKNVVGVGMTTDNYVDIHRRFGVGLQADLMRFVSGEVTDTDYEQDNRVNQVFYAREDANKGFSASLSPLLQFKIVDRSVFQMTIGAGHQWTSKKFYLVNAESNLNSSYQAFWKGPVGKLKSHYKLGSFRFQASSTYSQVNYNAKANWNLIDEFERPVSFRHEAKGFVWFNELALLYPLKSIFHIKASVKHSYSSTGKGIDILYKVDGSRPRTQLNDVTNQAMMLSVGVVMVWK
ncbi:hypothetical protein [Marinoscillum pacificum]|uniref:hypothetical protein n=1 Tax=Marinoscillum pacificum TaxID=392723 RepID=UPI002157D491|nr:hypothetical protein [Marinoscillum pacificum]